MPPPAKRSGPAARPSSANGGSSTAPSPTAWRKPVTGSSPSRVCRQVSGAACAPPMPLSDCTRSSSEGSRPRPCCHRPIPPPCCSGHYSLPDRSACARSMAGKRSPPSQSISQLTSPRDQIPSSRSRRANSNHIPDGTLIENLVVANRLGKSLGLYGILFLGQNGIFDERIGFMAHENATQIGMRLQSRRQIHLVANDGVIHPVLAAEVADSAIAGVDTDPQLERLFQAGIAPLELKLAHSSLHCDGHVDAIDGVLLDTLRLRIAEECQDRVADVLVDGSTMIESDLRHLGEVVVEQTGQLLGFKIIGRSGEIRDVREEHGQLLSVRSDLDAALAGENRRINLG